MSQPTRKTYRGNCHCAAFVFEATLPEITKIHPCNCSICAKKGAVWVSVKKDDFSLVKGDLGTAKEYRFGSKNFGHKFCPTCGTALLFTVDFAGPPTNGEKKDPPIGVNLRSFQYGQINDLWKMEAKQFDGANMGAPYKPPQYDGPLPNYEIDGAKLYTGSCHCGLVTVCVKTKPLDDNFEGSIYICNCSSCNRAGGACFWPHKEQVIIQGEEHLTGYSSGSLKAWESQFCSNCGVFVARRPLPISDEIAAVLPPQAREWTVDAQHLLPVNSRIMNEVDLSKLKITYIEGYENIPPLYVNP